MKKDPNLKVASRFYALFEEISNCACNKTNGPNYKSVLESLFQTFHEDITDQYTDSFNGVVLYPDGSCFDISFPGKTYKDIEPYICAFFGDLLIDERIIPDTPYIMLQRSFPVSTDICNIENQYAANIHPLILEECSYSPESAPFGPVIFFKSPSKITADIISLNFPIDSDEDDDIAAVCKLILATTKGGK